MKNWAVYYFSVHNSHSGHTELFLEHAELLYFCMPWHEASPLPEMTLLFSFVKAPVEIHFN